MPHKRSTRKEIKRLDHKSERAAVRQAIEGGHVRQPSKMNWSSPSDPTPIVDESPSTGSRKKKGCPKNHGGDHAPVYQTYTRGSGEWQHTYSRVVCDFCGKHRYWSVKGWNATPRPRPVSKHYYAVYTTTGIYVDTYPTFSEASVVCVAKNLEAYRLDISTRYVVR